MEEDAAAVLRGDTIEVLGAAGALLVDLSEATTDPRLGAFNLSNARLTYLGDGDRYDLRTRTLTTGRAKLDGQLIDPRAPDFKPYHDDAPFALDVLAGGVVLDRMVRIVDGKATESRGLAFDASPDAAAPRDLGFEFRFIRRPDTIAWYDPVRQRRCLHALPTSGSTWFRCASRNRCSNPGRGDLNDEQPPRLPDQRHRRRDGAGARSVGRRR